MCVHSARHSRFLVSHFAPFTLPSFRRAQTPGSAQPAFGSEYLFKTRYDIEARNDVRFLFALCLIAFSYYFAIKIHYFGSCFLVSFFFFAVFPFPFFPFSFLPSFSNFYSFSPSFSLSFVFLLTFSPPPFVGLQRRRRRRALRLSWRGRA